MARGDPILGNIPTSPDNGHTAVLDEHLRAIQELTQEIRELRRGGNGGPPKKTWQEAAIRLGVTLMAALLCFLAAWVWTLDRGAVARDLLIRANEGDIAELKTELRAHRERDGGTSPDVERRLGTLERWRERHQESGR